MGPVAPIAPVGPVGPVAPVAPVGPVGPVAPLVPGGQLNVACTCKLSKRKVPEPLAPLAITRIYKLL